MVIFNNESHFYFYKARFSGGKLPLTIVHEEKKYYEGLVIHGVLFLLVVAVLTAILVGEVWLSIVVFLLILLEKIFDEIQRYLQFDQQFVLWSKLMLFRQLVPFFCVLVSSRFSTSDLVLSLVFFASSLIVGVLQAYYYLSKRQYIIVRNCLKEISVLKIRGYILYYRKKLVWNQLQSFLTRNVALLDRLVVRYVEESFLAVMSIISQLGSLCILFVDYFLISHRRKEYLEKGKKIFDIVTPITILVFWVAALVFFGIVVTLGWYLNFFREANGYYQSVLLIGLYYSFFAISQHFSNFNFWNRARLMTISVDLIYFFTALSIFIPLFFISQFLLIDSLIVALIAGHLIRLVLQVALALKNPKVTKEIEEK